MSGSSSATCVVYCSGTDAACSVGTAGDDDNDAAVNSGTVIGYYDAVSAVIASAKMSDMYDITI